MPHGCLFCHVKDQVLIAENELFYARLDPFPANEGHLEVVSKWHADRYFDLTRGQRIAAWDLIDTAEKTLRDRGIHAEGYNLGINDGPAAGRTQPHLHIHLIPRHHGDHPDPRGGIRRGLPNGDPDAWSHTPAYSASRDPRES